MEPAGVDEEFLVIQGVVLVGALVAWIFFLYTLYSAATKVSASRQQLTPGLVWLNLIPLFNYVWMFFTVIWLAQGLVSEADERASQKSGTESPDDTLSKIKQEEGGKVWGLVYAGLLASTIIPGVNLLTGIPALVLWIIYWVKVSKYKSALS